MHFCQGRVTSGNVYLLDRFSSIKPPNEILVQSEEMKFILNLESTRTINNYEITRLKSKGHFEVFMPFIVLIYGKTNTNILHVCRIHVTDLSIYTTAKLWADFSELLATF
jgi:hypothetical protein